MNKLILAGIVGATFAAAGGQVYAADMPVPQPAPAEPAACSNSTYVGAQAGIVDMSSQWTGEDYWFEDIDADLGDQGLAAGVFIGHDMNCGGFVFGAEADYNFFDINDSTSWIDGPEGLTVTTHTQGLGSVRVRVGVPVSNLLFYATAGVAAGSVSASYDIDSIARQFSDSAKFKFGWVAGGGVEAKLTDNVGVRLQGLYYDLGSVSFPEADNAGSHYAADAKAWLVSAGLTWHF